MDWDPYRALYVHVPFCKRRCAYCDFATCAVPPDSPQLDSYVEEVIAAIRGASRSEQLGAIETVYFGGGTPSFYGAKRLKANLFRKQTPLLIAVYTFAFYASYARCRMHHRG